MVCLDGSDHRPRLLPMLGAVPVGEQSEVWRAHSGVSRRRIKPPDSLVVHAHLFFPPVTR